MRQKILILVGPTSSGKSALAVELARRFNGEVISADSRQVYRGLNIGTGKITKREMRGVPHHLLDVASPKKIFTAHDFVKKARAACSNILQNDKLCIVCGGTGFYIDALVGRTVLPNVPPNLELRKKLEKKTAAQLFSMLKKKDPSRARMMDTSSERNNKVRLIRALEIASTLNHIPDVMDVRHPYDALWIGISPQMKAIEKKITIRLFARIREGMVAEARRLHKDGLSYKRMEALGLEYRSLARLLQGKITRAQMIDELDRAIRHYAKRQMTYWKRNKNIKWFDPKDRRDIEKAVYAWLTK